jgi:hypothetical protein
MHLYSSSIAPGPFEEQLLSFDATLHFVLNANRHSQSFCDSKHRRLTVKVEASAVYLEFHRRI